MIDPLHLLLGDDRLLQGEDDPPTYDAPVVPDPLAGGDVAGGGTGTDTPTPDDTGPGPFADFGAKKATSLSVPQNILDWIEQAAADQGVPTLVLAAVIHQRVNGRWTSLSPQIIAGVAQRLGAAFDERASSMDVEVSTSDKKLFNEQTRLMWLTAASDYASGAPSTSDNWNRYWSQIDAFTSKDPTIAPDVSIPAGRRQLASFPGGVGGGYGYGTGGGAATAPIVPGLSDARAIEVQRVADQLWLQYLGRYPTNAEYQSIAANGWNADQVESFLRQRPYGNTDATLGQVSDARQMAIRQFQAVLGRDPTDGELNYIIVSHIPVTDISAYAEQIRDHTVWAVNPDKYRLTRERVAAALAKYGIQLTNQEISADLVNKAAQGNWTDQQLASEIGKMQAPGMPAGTTLSQYKSTADLTRALWSSYFPGDQVGDDVISKLLGMTPDQITAYVRSLPSKEDSSIQVGVYHDSRASAQNALSRLGVTRQDPNKDEIEHFARAGMDPEAIEKFYRNLPELVAENPGLPYGMSREQYEQQSAGLRGAFESAFGPMRPGGPGGEEPIYEDRTTGGGTYETGMPDPNKPGETIKGRVPETTTRVQTGTRRTPGTPSPDLDALMREGFTPESARDLFADYFKRLGRAPTIDEIRQERTKAKPRYQENIIGAGGRATAVGPTMAGLGAPPRRGGG